MLNFARRTINRLYLLSYYIVYLCFGKKIKIHNADDTLLHIMKSKSSICRFGDGEFNMIIQYKTGKLICVCEGFQDYDERLAKRLFEILDEGSYGNLCVCIPYWFRAGLFDYKKEVQMFCLSYIKEKMKYLSPFLKPNKEYYNANISRFYLSRKDKSHCRDYVKLLKKLWEKANICFVEGECSRLGVGNDLFDNAKTIKRILCPMKNAYDKYEEILYSVKERVSKDNLIIIALGHTATVLAYDLSKLGYQALDLGHIDVEYEWMLLGVNDKVPLKNKYVNEAIGGDKCTIVDDPCYQSQIIDRVF